MNLPRIVGHDHVWETFRRALERGRLASTFLFVGPAGIGKRSTAVGLAQALLCESVPTQPLHACQTCPACQQVAAQTHPDLVVIGKPEDKSYIPVESFIGDREHRMRQGLCHDIALKPFRGGRKIAIIDDADYLNQEGANCLLKTLEEPPRDSLIILIGSSEQRQLPTIRSRCQVIRFAPLSTAHLATLLATTGLITDPTRISAVAARAEGSLTRALELCDPELEDARNSLLQHLSQADIDSGALAKVITEFVEAAGKETSPRRVRLRQIVMAAADFYRSLMRQLVGAGEHDETGHEPYLARAAPHWIGRADAASRNLERCLVGLGEIDANANVATLIGCWIDDLAQGTLPRG
ncbi:MAG: DNA polymerase III subunit [Pirellulaceae bacterium]